MEDQSTVVLRRCERQGPWLYIPSSMRKSHVWSEREKGWRAGDSVLGARRCFAQPRLPERHAESLSSCAAVRSYAGSAGKHFTILPLLQNNLCVWNLLSCLKFIQYPWEL